MILAFCAYAVYQFQREAEEQTKFRVEIICHGCTIVARKTQ
jgi:hypothetical protein